MVKEINSPNSQNPITVGEARSIALKNPRVASIFESLKRSGVFMKPDEVTKQMRREGYKGWRELNLLIQSQDISNYHGRLYSRVNKLNPNYHDDNSTPFDDENFVKAAEGGCLMSEHSWECLYYLAKDKSISAQSLEELNGISASKWSGTFGLVNAGWAIDNNHGLTISSKGMEMAIDLSIAPDYQEESARRELKRTLRGKTREFEKEAIRLKGNLYEVAATKAKSEILSEDVSADSIEQINPLTLKDLIIFKNLAFLHKKISSLDRYTMIHPSQLSVINSLEQCLAFEKPEDFEEKLEELGRDKFSRIQQGEEFGDFDNQIEQIEHIYDCLKFIWQPQGQKEFVALQTIQQLLNVPFWSEEWQFRRGMNYAYQPNPQKQTNQDSQITIGTIVQKKAIGHHNQEYFLDQFDEEEYLVEAFDQGMYSGFYAHYQHVYLRNSENWISSCYLANIRPASSN